MLLGFSDTAPWLHGHLRSDDKNGEEDGEKIKITNIKLETI